MAARRPALPRSIVRGPMARAPQPAGVLPADQPVDVEALFNDTMRRYPATMARLAE